MSEEIKAKMKACFPEGLEAIMISKDDYDRLCGDLTYRNVVLQQENQQLKEKYLNAASDYETTKSENQQLKEKIEWYEKENKHNQEIIIKDTKVLDEIREITKELYEIGVEWHWDNGAMEDYVKEILQILDKVKE